MANTFVVFVDYNVKTIVTCLQVYTNPKNIILKDISEDVRTMYTQGIVTFIMWLSVLKWPNYI